jgi:hypothetical protein
MFCHPLVTVDACAMVLVYVVPFGYDVLAMTGRLTVVAGGSGLEMEDCSVMNNPHPPGLSPIDETPFTV